MTGARVRIHADRGVHVPERITATPQSVAPENAAGPGGRAASGRSLRVSAVSAERGIFSGPVTSSGVHIKAAGFPSTAEGRNPHPGKKRERLRAGFLRFPRAVRAHLQPIISFQDGFTCFSHPVSSIHLFISLF